MTTLTNTEREILIEAKKNQDQNKWTWAELEVTRNIIEKEIKILELCIENYGIFTTPEGHDYKSLEQLKNELSRQYGGLYFQGAVEAIKRLSDKSASENTGGGFVLFMLMGIVVFTVAMLAFG